MAQPAPAYGPETVQQPSEPRERETISLSVDASAGAYSPARHMQETLGREFAAHYATEEAWPLRRTVAFVMLTCGAFWTAVYFLIAAFVG